MFAPEYSRRTQYSTKSEVQYFYSWEYCGLDISNVSRSVRKPYLRATYHVHKIGYLLVCGISLPVTQLFVIAIENLLQGVCVGNLTRVNETAQGLQLDWPSETDTLKNILPRDQEGYDGFEYTDKKLSTRRI